MSDALSCDLGLFGKLPSRGDFVWAGRRKEGERAFEAWLSAMIEQAKGELRPHPARYLLVPEAGEALLGTWVPSLDAAGRAFPLAITVALGESMRDAPWPLFLPLHGAYFDAVEACLRVARERAIEEAYDRVRALSLPHPSLVPAAIIDARGELGGERASNFAQRLLGGAASEGQLAYALCTLAQAVERRADQLTLDFPCEDDFDLFVWCSLLRALGCATPPAALLWEPSSGHAFVSLTHRDESMLAFLNAPDHASPRRWPVWTSRVDARRAASAQLPPPVRAALTHDVTLAELLDALGGEP